jgi:hypothetical protein
MKDRALLAWFVDDGIRSSAVRTKDFRVFASNPTLETTRCLAFAFDGH